mmetsp:Transcript_12909/g.27875  ORF Transcript_12909/g.27875 Transcript_12909/m.27875 type:complete len:204 (-) Transcript_12909:153-764(-)
MTLVAAIFFPTTFVPLHSRRMASFTSSCTLYASSNVCGATSPLMREIFSPSEGFAFLEALIYSAAFWCFLYKRSPRLMSKSIFPTVFRSCNIFVPLTTPSLVKSIFSCMFKSNSLRFNIWKTTPLLCTTSDLVRMKSCNLGRVMDRLPSLESNKGSMSGGAPLAFPKKTAVPSGRRHSRLASALALPTLSNTTCAPSLMLIVP